MGGGWKTWYKLIDVHRGPTWAFDFFLQSCNADCRKIVMKMGCKFNGNILLCGRNGIITTMLAGCRA